MDALKPLVQRAMVLPPRSEARDQAVAELVDMMLRSRRVGRAPKGHSGEVYRTIYQRLRQQLLQAVGEAIAQAAVPLTGTAAWGGQMQQRVCYTVLDDQLLKQLALEAQSHGPGSDLRRHALAQLVEAIRLSGRLARPHRTTFSPMFYDLLYEEAVNKTLAYVCRRIDNYDPQRGNAKFMNWVNFRLDRTILDCRREFGEPAALPTLKDLEAIPQPEEPTVSEADQVRQCLEADVDDSFKAAHVRHHPQANFRAIALARLDGQSWETIAAALSVKVPTLSSFYQRCCHKFAEPLRACVEAGG